MGDLTGHRATVPVYAKLFALCRGGVKKAWTIQGPLPQYTPDSPLSSLGGTWDRSGAVDYFFEELSAEGEGPPDIFWRLAMISRISFML